MTLSNRIDLIIWKITTTSIKLSTHPRGADKDLINLEDTPQTAAADNKTTREYQLGRSGGGLTSEIAAEHPPTSMIDTEEARPRLLEAFDNPQTNLYFRSPGMGQTPGLTDRLMMTDPAHAATWIPDYGNTLGERPYLGGQRLRPEAVAVSGHGFGDNLTIKHTPPVPHDVDAPTHLVDLAYDPLKFISILGEKWDPGCVTTPKPTGYPLASEARTKILAGATTMA